MLAARPDAIVAGVTGTADAAATLRAWQTAGVPAALRGHVYGIDADSLYRPTGRLIDAAEQLCARLDEARG
ncbi:periplasmic binding protein [Bordetella pertussis]|nr:periplasmic binding protein [Bordetella pertussis]